MSAASGAMVLIKVGDGGGPEQFTTIGGLRTSEMDVNNQLIDASNVESGAWRLLLSGSGLQSVRITGKGIFVDSNEEEAVRASTFANSIKNYRFLFSNGDMLQGAFRITRYQRGGEYNDAEYYLLTMDSAGPLTYTAA